MHYIIQCGMEIGAVVVGCALLGGLSVLVAYLVYQLIVA